MTDLSHNPGLPRSRRQAPHTRADLERWLERYRESVGPPSQPCAEWLQALFDVDAVSDATTDLLLELLEILEALLADLRTRYEVVLPTSSTALEAG